MIMDQSLDFADSTTGAFSVVGVAATYSATNVIDQTTGFSIIGQTDLDNDLFLVIEVATAIFTGGSAGTIQFQLVSSAASSLSSPVIHALSPQFVTGATPGIPAGTVLVCLQLPQGGSAAAGHQYLRYLGVQAIVGTTTTTSGAVYAFLTQNPPSWQPTAAFV